MITEYYYIWFFIIIIIIIINNLLYLLIYSINNWYNDRLNIIKISILLSYIINIFFK